MVMMPVSCTTTSIAKRAAVLHPTGEWKHIHQTLHGTVAVGPGRVSQLMAFTIGRFISHSEHTTHGVPLRNDQAAMEETLKGDTRKLAPRIHSLATALN